MENNAVLAKQKQNEKTHLKNENASVFYLVTQVPSHPGT
jgi:hypothetical protein